MPNPTKTMEVDYFFDALGRRIAKKVNDRGIEFTQHYLYLGTEDKILLAKNGVGEVQLQVDGQGIDEHLGHISSSEVKTYVTDHLGTVLNGEAAGDKKITGAFGEILGTVGPTDQFSNPVMYGFTGRQLDSENMLYYYRNRSYDPHSGRFMSMDPIGFEGGDVNLYRYVGNSSTNKIDPSGTYIVDLTLNGISPTIKSTEVYRKAQRSPTKIIIYSAYEGNNILGYTRPDPGVPYKELDPVTISIAPGQSYNDEGLTIAHELGHALSIIDSNNRSDTDYEHDYIIPGVELDALSQRDQRKACGN